MAANSSIEWTGATWNPVTGCTKISAGCKNCYAERMARRLQAMGHPTYTKGFQVTPHERLLDVPLRWKKPRVVFVNSMSDLFHEAVPPEFILRVFDVMNRADRHVFQILTKRAERLAELNPRLPWTPNVWMGVTVEHRANVDRIEHLRRCHAHTKFLSLEPLLSAVPGLGLNGIDWVIVGGESGPGARPMKPQWVRDIRDLCSDAQVPFFFKQWGGVNKKKTGRILDSRTWDEMPPVARQPQLGLLTA